MTACEVTWRYVGSRLQPQLAFVLLCITCVALAQLSSATASQAPVCLPTCCQVLLCRSGVRPGERELRRKQAADVAAAAAKSMEAKSLQGLDTFGLSRGCSKPPDKAKGMAMGQRLL